MTTKNLAATITIGGTLTAGLKGALGSTTKALKDIGTEIKKVKDRQKELNAEVAQHMRHGRSGMAAGYVLADLRDVESRLNRLRTAQSRLNDAAQRSQRVNSVTGFDMQRPTMKSAGIKMTATGAVMIAAMVPGVNQAKKYETERGRIDALGMGADVTARAEKTAKELKQYGIATIDKLELMRDALAVFGDEHHAEMALPTLAKMKFANRAFFGGEHGADNESKFMDMLKVIELRGGTKSEADFKKQAGMIQRVISATGGRVGGEEWRHVIARGGLAAQGMRDDAFFYQLEPLVQMMGGDGVGTGMASAYSALYQGKTTKKAVQNLDRLGLLADKSKVIHDKAGQTAGLNPGALLGAKVFRESQYEWVKTVLIPQLAKKGITSKDAIEDTIGSFVSNKVGANLLTKMYDQQALIDKDEKRNRSSYNVDELEGAAKKTASGAEIDAEAKYMDAKQKLGATILPTYTKALLAASDALSSFNSFADRHGTLVSVMVGGVAALGAGLVVLGPILTVAGAGLSAYAAFQLRAATMATRAAAAITTETAAIESQNLAAAGGGKMRGAAGLAAKAATAFVVTDLALAGARAAGLPDVDQAKGEQEARDGKWMAASAHMSAGSFIKALVTGAPEAPPMRGAAAATPAVTQHITNNITQLPGESAEALARRLTDMQKHQQAVKQRGALTDGATAN